jgi:hypothetical protein
VTQILFEIAAALDIHLAPYEAIMKRTFNNFARILFDVDLNYDLRKIILGKKNDFDFYMDVEYEKLTFYQSLVGSVVIDAELDREDHSSIPRNCDQKEAETTYY